MNAAETRRIDRMIEDSIMEMPIGFTVGCIHYFLYPVTLGTAYLISREREGMAENVKEIFEKSSNVERLNYRRSLCRIVAIQTLKEKCKILDLEELNERADTLYQALDDEDLFKLYDIIMESLEDAKLFIKSSGLINDKKKLAKIAKHKEYGGNFVFGGRTPYGSIIGPACEKFGWTIEYVVWGVSLVNLQMLLADEQTSVYLSKDDRRQLRLSPDRDVIDANNPANTKLIRKILKGE